MAIIKPFKALRPRPDLAQKIAALPYDVYNTKEAKEAAADNPYSFLHVDKAEIDLEDGISLYDNRVYNKAYENFKLMVDKGWLVKDDTNALYIYRLVFMGRSQTGIAGLSSIDEYLQGTIKKHELTREDKEKDRIRHIQCLNAQTGPIFMAYKANARLKELIEAYTKAHVPIYDMSFEDGTNNTVWRVAQEDVINAIITAFNDVESLYIADGHHRNAAAAKVGLLKRQENPGYKGDEPFNYYLSVSFPDDELHILDYNRVVKDLNGFSEKEFIERISEYFHISHESSCVEPARLHEFGMFLEDKWYRLTAKSQYINEDDVLDSLDVSILQNLILGPILKIKDVRTNDRIDFIGGIRGLLEIERRVGLDMKAGFSMFPTSMEQLMEVAAKGQIMPPKSTWFEPKLRSGIFIHEI